VIDDQSSKGGRQVRFLSCRPITCIARGKKDQATSLSGSEHRNGKINLCADTNVPRYRCTIRDTDRFDDDDGVFLLMMGPRGNTPSRLWMNCRKTTSSGVPMAKCYGTLQCIPGLQDHRKNEMPWMTCFSTVTTCHEPHRSTTSTYSPIVIAALLCTRSAVAQSLLAKRSALVSGAAYHLCP
jgi:hypothetical protein